MIKVCVQALETIPKLKSIIPIERAEMRIRVNVSSKEANKFKEKLLKLASKVESEKWDTFDLSLVSKILNYYIMHLAICLKAVKKYIFENNELVKFINSYNSYRYC